jgi:ribonuclease VapC
MVIDASALVVVLTGEPEERIFDRAIVRAPTRLLSPVNWLETAMVLAGRSLAARDALDAYVNRIPIEIVPIDVAQMRIADQAWRIYGKGRQHPAQLNLGDCFAYALAKQLGEPLLFKGDDFSKTDVLIAV